MRITCDITLDSGCENAGIVFGYVDNQNYWAVIFSKATQTRKVYQVVAGERQVRRLFHALVIGGPRGLKSAARGSSGGF